MLGFIGSAITGLFGLIGTTVGSVFGFKGEQAKTVQSALDVLKSVNDTDAQSITASASAISAILTQGSFLERLWRPVLMIVFMVLVISYWFGFTPPNFNQEMSPMMQKIFDLLAIGIGGYIPCRTIEKIANQINIGKILTQLIGKKFV